MPWPRGTDMQMNAAARQTALRVGVVVLALLAAPRVVFESRRLLFGQTWYDATDIKNFHNLTVTWLSRQDIYATVANADYPPASFPLMFPMYVLDNRWRCSVPALRSGTDNS